MMQKHRKITIERLEKFTSKEFFSDANIQSQIYRPGHVIKGNDNEIGGKNHPLEVTYFSIQSTPPQSQPSPNIKSSSNGPEIPVSRMDPIYHNVSFDEMMTLTDKWTKGVKMWKAGDSFGPSWSTHWFRIRGSVPPEWISSLRLSHENDVGIGKDSIVLRWMTGAEGLVYRSDGVVLQGLVDRREHIEIYNQKGLTTTTAAKTATATTIKFDFFIEMACNTMFGNGLDGLINAPKEDKSFTLSVCELAILQLDVYALLHDFQIIADLARHLPEDSQGSCDALYTANKIINTWYPDDKETWEKAQQVAHEFLRSGKDAKESHEIVAVAHCHIDTAWLWPYRETRRKVARSWASQMHLMEKYPNTILFVCSQAQQYAWLKEDYPELFKRLQSKVLEGHFYPIGGSWIETDGNVPSGESFIRQFVYGQRFFADHFNGMQSKIFWLPDTFGYSSQIPQIMKQCGVDYFFTQKLSWNNINTFPHTTFYWQGLDGTRVLTHFSPTNTYCSQANVKEVLFSISNNKDKDRANASLLVYGDGDGGGGATPQMMEFLTRMSKGVPGLPKISVHKTPLEFYKDLEKRSRDLVTWNGELYFELHRGTYTSQAANKAYNRRCEFLLRQVEALYTILSSNSTALPCAGYPFKVIDECWKIVLLNQFHDVLPGSSIQQVYKDSLNLYARVETTLLELQRQGLSRLLQSGAGGYWNSLPFERAGKYSLIEKEKGSGAVTLVRNENVSGYAVVAMPLESWEKDQVGPLDSHEKVSVYKEGELFYLENELVRVAVNGDGQITSYQDKEAGNREIVQPGQALNVLRIYEDIPLFWDAWDIEIYHLEKGKTIKGQSKVEVYEVGPFRASLKVQVNLCKGDDCISRVLQYIQLSPGSKLVTFDVEIDWWLRHQLLKVEFGTGIKSDVATFDTQFGVVPRPTHRNTSWEMAKFEVCGHRFVDLSEHGYGVTLFSDSKYGFSVLDGRMTISLLRGPTAPDPDCDKGKHSFKYGFMGHCGGSWQNANIYQLAYQFNVPLIPIVNNGEDESKTEFKGKVENGLNQFFHLDTLSPESCSGKLFVETVKFPFINEDNSKEILQTNNSSSIIVRMFEGFGGRGKAQITHGTSKTISKISVINALEDQVYYYCQVARDRDSNNDNQEKFIIDFGPFQIITIRIEYE